MTTQAFSPTTGSNYTLRWPFSAMESLGSGNRQHDVLDSAKGLAYQTPRISKRLFALHSTDGNGGSPPFANWIGLPHLLHRRGFPRLDPSLWHGKLCQSDRHHCVVVSLLLALVSALSRKAFGQKFAKICIILFAVAILSLGVVRSAVTDRSPQSSQPPDQNAN